MFEITLKVSVIIIIFNCITLLETSTMLKGCRLTLLFIFLFSTKAFPKEYADTISIRKPHIVFLISKDIHNYEADRTIPIFAQKLKEQYGWTTTVLQAEGERTAAQFPGLQSVLPKADLMVIFARRLALPPEQMQLIKNWFKIGKPMIGIRTANHAFSVAKNELKAGYIDWWDFVPEILGCVNNGYGAVEPGTDLSIITEQKNHEILKNIPERWHSNGNLYLIAEENNIVPLLKGTINSANEQPVAWSRMVGKSRIFYTSLGHPDDFETVPFNTLLTNAVLWTLQLQNSKNIPAK